MRIQLNDIDIAYEERGSGLPLLMIHGFPLNRAMWEPQIEELSGIARVLAPDLRGHGDTSTSGDVYSMDLLAEDLYQFLQATGVTERVVLCGLSMGGYVIFSFLRKYPDIVAGIILAATRAAADIEEGKTRRQEMADLALKEGPGAVIDKMLPQMMSPLTYQKRPELVKRVKAIMGKTPAEGIYAAQIGMKMRPDSTGTLRQFSGPALILHGQDDQLIPVGEARGMQEAISGSSLVVIPKAGHLLNLEQPGIFNQAVVQFIKSL
jgi:3-oxoadipate enol-lactonase